jgi:hypothetical protein
VVRCVSVQVPHSLALDEAAGALCVADRERARIECFDLDGAPRGRVITAPAFGAALFAVAVDARSGTMYALNGGRESAPPEDEQVRTLYRLGARQFCETTFWGVLDGVIW